VDLADLPVVDALHQLAIADVVPPLKTARGVGEAFDGEEGTGGEEAWAGFHADMKTDFPRGT
jgi:hypothetical protein